MGYNTSLVVMNDALSFIRDDKDFGKKLADAANAWWTTTKPIDINAGNFVNAATVIESHHSSGLVPILFGFNRAYPISVVIHEDRREAKTFRDQHDAWEVDLLLQLAHKHGYTLRKKVKR